MKNLLSRNNPKIKQIHHLLRQRKQRLESGLFVVEGIRHVGEACAANASVEYICYAPELLTIDFALQLIKEESDSGISCYAVDEATFTQLAGKDNPQGILAIVHQPSWQLDDLSGRISNGELCSSARESLSTALAYSSARLAALRAIMGTPRLDR